MTMIWRFWCWTEFFLFVKSLSLIRAISGPLQDVIWGSTSKPRVKAWARCPEPTTIHHIAAPLLQLTPHSSVEDQFWSTERGTKSQFSVAYTVDFQYFCLNWKWKAAMFHSHWGATLQDFGERLLPKRVKLWRWQRSPTFFSQMGEAALNICGIKKIP